MVNRLFQWLGCPNNFLSVEMSAKLKTPSMCGYIGDLDFKVFMDLTAMVNYMKLRLPDLQCTESGRSITFTRDGHEVFEAITPRFGNSLSSDDVMDVISMSANTIGPDSDPIAAVLKQYVKLIRTMSVYVPIWSLPNQFGSKLCRLEVDRANIVDGNGPKDKPTKIVPIIVKRCHPTESANNKQPIHHFVLICASQPLPSIKIQLYRCVEQLLMRPDIPELVEIVKSIPGVPM